MKKVVCIFIFLAVIIEQSVAQINDDLFSADSLSKGLSDVQKHNIQRIRLIDANTEKPVTLAHVVNIDKRVGTISDMAGFFSLPVSFGDSLIISSIGYEKKYELCIGLLQSDTMTHVIRLKPKIYEIDEVRISRFTTYENFLESVVNLKLPKSEQELLEERMSKYMKGVERRTGIIALPQATSGVMFGRDWLMKQKDKVDGAHKEERNQDLINKKFSHGMIEQITGFSGDSLLRFIAYLDFKNDYLLNVTEYEIRMKINEKLKQFLEQKIEVAADSIK